MAQPDPRRRPRKTPRNIFAEQAANRRLSRLLIGAFVAFVGFLGLGVDLFYLGYGSDLFLGRAAAKRLRPDAPRVPLATIVALAVGGLSAWVGYHRGDRAVLAASGARPMMPNDPNARVLMNVVAEMAIAGGLPWPKVWVIDEPDPNAFATGRDPNHASIAVTTGLLTAMERDELQGVVAHEMAHIRNYDIRAMMVVAALLGAVLLLHDWTFRLRLEGRRRRGDRKARVPVPPGLLALVVFLVWLPAIALAPLVGRLLAAAVSRQREYLADASGAELTRNPTGLASALRKLEAAIEPTRRIHRGTAHLCIVDPLGRAVNEREGAWADLMATHPPMHDRIARLEAMAYQG